MAGKLKVALVGNPNSGKTSLFNQLTGLNQQTANFPGVTVERHTGFCKMSDGSIAEITDLPGMYSLYPRSLDERIVAEFLLNHRSKDCPDVVVVVADATNLKRGLLLLTQIVDIGLPVVLALNMMDQAAKAGINYDLHKMQQLLGVRVIPTNARTGYGVDTLKQALLQTHTATQQPVYALDNDVLAVVKELREKTGVDNDYEAYQLLEQPVIPSFLSDDEKEIVQSLKKKYNLFPGKYHGAETIQRYGFIQDLLDQVTIRKADEEWKRYTFRLDRILTHRIYGYVIFLFILLLIFQSIFSWATLPMDWIDTLFASLSNYLSNNLPEGPLTKLLADGIVPGIGGIVMFVPQIAILFAFISILEESGYMARVVFIMDKIMRKFGLNGRSVVPLMSGVACAIPAILSTRMIDNWKERLITILVTPFMSCSARIPVFTILIALIIPEETVLGVFNLQGLTLMGLYLLGFFAAIGSAWVLKKLLRSAERSYLLLELPPYRMPRWNNVGITIFDKTRSFVVEAGKIILAISIVLWVLSSYGPSSQMKEAEMRARGEAAELQLAEDELQDKIAAYQLEQSYAGKIGKAIEPIIKPLGYDWKIGIALLTSFAAREVFVGTMATIYSIGSRADDENTIKSRMQQEINPDTGGPRFTFATGLSLLLFYTFAMQCMSTLAVVYRETQSWKWPLLQLVFMSALAYVSALVAYQYFA
ncbi:MAG: ferrous iron transport protein B [Cyclobacteriaceae bacterium]|nr:ferrous iron transport protein B [Cyclobacteriaceae bacterium]